MSLGLWMREEEDHLQDCQIKMALPGVDGMRGVVYEIKSHLLFLVCVLLESMMLMQNCHIKTLLLPLHLAYGTW